jgi:hypothetical protein
MPQNDLLSRAIFVVNGIVGSVLLSSSTKAFNDAINDAFVLVFEQRSQEH